jgi:hypothetical protein
MSKQELFHQGDVFLLRVNKVPDTAKLAPRDSRGRVVIAHGEVTGHAHAFGPDQKVQMLIDDHNGVLTQYFKVGATYPANVPIHGEVLEEDDDTNSVLLDTAEYGQLKVSKAYFEELSPGIWDPKTGWSKQDHEEHSPHAVPEGLYSRKPQREYQPGAVPRIVAD